VGLRRCGAHNDHLKRLCLAQRGSSTRPMQNAKLRLQ
jgi:hypothetical protein